MAKKKTVPAHVELVIEPEVELTEQPAPEPVGPLPMGGAAVAYVLPNGGTRPATVVQVNADATLYLKVAVQPGDGYRNPLPLPSVVYSADKLPGTWHWPAEE